MLKIVLVSISFLIVSACEKPQQLTKADAVFQGGAVYRVTDADAWATAVAIVGDKIVYVGDDTGAAAWIGDKTKVVNLNSKMLMPGFQDSHVHLSLIHI